MAADNSKMVVAQDKLPPKDIDMEKFIVGTLLQSYITPEQIQEVREIISPDMFYDDTCRAVFRLVCKMNDNGETVDASTVMMQVLADPDISQEKYVDIMMCSYASYVECIERCPMLVRYATRRNMWTLGQTLVKLGLTMEGDENKILTDSQDQIAKMQEGVGTDMFRSMQDTIKEFSAIIQDNMSGKNQTKHSYTGFAFLDFRGGLQSGDLVIIAGATSMGKTTFANSMVFNAAVEGSKVAIYSLEMTSLQLTSRMLSKYTKIASNRMLTAPLNADELKRFDDGVTAVWDVSERIYFDDRSTSSIDNILASIRRMKQKHDISGVVIDYIQLVSGQQRGESKEDFLAACTRRLKNIAKELDIWAIALSQLNRDKENPMPNLDRLRGSGQIAEAADVVLMVYRPQYYNEVEGKNLSYPSPNENVSTRGTALILLEKGRNIGTGSFICGFNSASTNFFDLSTLPLKGQGESMNAEEKRKHDVKQEILPF